MFQNLIITQWIHLDKYEKSLRHFQCETEQLLRCWKTNECDRNAWVTIAFLWETFDFHRHKRNSTTHRKLFNTRSFTSYVCTELRRTTVSIFKYVFFLYLEKHLQYKISNENFTNRKNKTEYVIHLMYKISSSATLYHVTYCFVRSDRWDHQLAVRRTTRDRSLSG